MPRKLGVGTKLNPALQEKICEYLQLGLPEESAAWAAGISDSVYWKWKAHGIKHPDGPYGGFADAVKKALGDMRASNLAIIKMAARNGAWQAAAWILERRLPSEFARRERIEHDMPGGGNVTINVGFSGPGRPEQAKVVTVKGKKPQQASQELGVPDSVVPLLEHKDAKDKTK